MLEAWVLVNHDTNQDQLILQKQLTTRPQNACWHDSKMTPGIYIKRESEGLSTSVKLASELYEPEIRPISSLVLACADALDSLALACAWREYRN